MDSTLKIRLQKTDLVLLTFPLVLLLLCSDEINHLLNEPPHEKVSAARNQRKRLAICS